MEMSIIEISNCITESSWVGISGFLLFILAIFSFTAGRKWKIIRKQEKRIEQLEAQLIEKEELAKILNIKLN